MHFDNRTPQKLPAQRSLARPGGASFPAQRGPLGPCAALSMTCLAGIAGIALCVQNSLAQQAGAGGRAAAPPGRGAQPPDLRVQQRTHDFADTNEDLPYAVFVSSRVTKDKKNPLIIALHGLGGNPNTLMRGNALDLAEEGGYIVFAPAGYNPRLVRHSMGCSGACGNKGRNAERT